MHSVHGRLRRVSLLIGKRQDILLMFIINMLFALSFNMVTSLQVLFIGSRGADALEIGLVVSAQGFFSTLIMIPTGLLGERFGKKKMLFVNTSLAVLIPILYTFSRSLEELLPWTVAYGAVFPTFIVARMSLIAEYSSSENRATVFGFMNTTWAIGGLFGPPIAGLLADVYGWSPLFHLASLVSFLTIIPVWFLREPKRAYEKREPSLDHHTRAPVILKIVLALYFILFVMCAGMGVAKQVMPLYLTEVFNVNKTQVGLFLSIGVGLAVLLIQVPTGMVADRYGRQRMILLCSFVTPALYFLSPWIEQYLMLAVVYMLINASWSLTWPTSMALLVEAVPESKRNLAIGARQTLSRLGFTLGPLLGGYLWYLYEQGRLESVFAFYTSALFFVASIPAVLLLKKRAHVR